jgi:hypothetical protein
MLMGILALVVVAELNIVRIALLEPKANPPLVVDRNCILAAAITRQRMQAIAGGNPKVSHLRCDMYHLKLPKCPARYIGWQSLGLSSTKQLLGLPVREGLDHPVV